MKHVSEVLTEIADELDKRRDFEIDLASEVAVQYITDHRDTEAYLQVERETARLARAWDRMITKCKRWSAEAFKVETSCENFYGD